MLLADRDDLTAGSLGDDDEAGEGSDGGGDLQRGDLDADGRPDGDVRALGREDVHLVGVQDRPKPLGHLLDPVRVGVDRIVGTAFACPPRRRERTPR